MIQNAIRIEIQSTDGTLFVTEDPAEVQRVCEAVTKDMIRERALKWQTGARAKFKATEKRGSSSCTGK